MKVCMIDVSCMAMIRIKSPARFFGTKSNYSLEVRGKNENHDTKYTLGNKFHIQSHQGESNPGY